MVINKKKSRIIMMVIIIVLTVTVPNLISAYELIDFENLFNKHGSIMMIIEPISGEIVYVNDAAVNFYGWSKEELASMYIQDINMLTPEQVAAERMNALNEQRNFFVFKHKTNLGQVKDVEVYSYPINVDDQDLLFSIINDITNEIKEQNLLTFRNHLALTILFFSIVFQFYVIYKLYRKREENKLMNEHLKESETKFRQLFENIPMGIMLFNEEDDNRALIINKYAAGVIGIKAEKFQLIDHPGFYKAINSEADELEFEKIVNQQRKMIGLRKFRFMLNFQKILLVVFQDITSRVSQERELKFALEMQKNLERKLIQKEKMAAIGQLAAGVAHEINNPLGFVTGNFAALKKSAAKYQDVLRQCIEKIKQDDKLSEEVKEQFIEIIKETKSINNLDMIEEDLPNLISETEDGMKRIKDIVLNLRDFARMDNRDDHVWYNLNRGIETTLQIAHNEIKYAAIVEQKFEDIPDTKAIAHQVNQVILNLLINAAQAIKEKNKSELGKIIIMTWFDRDWVYMSVEDDGVGIKDEESNKLFEPFYTTKPPGKGTGLGLSISWDIIVNNHKGEILLDSIEGEGTVFTIRLPINTDTQ